MHTYRGQDVTVLRNAQPGDPDLDPISDPTLQVLFQYPPDPRLVDYDLLPHPPQGIIPVVSGICSVGLASDMLPTDLTLPLADDYVDNS